MKLINVDSVAVGNFNPAIPNPAWYARMGLIDPNKLQDIVSELRIDTHSLRHTAGSYRWSVSLDRFVVEVATTPINDDDVGLAASFLAATLGMLPHTPLTAVGNNFHFALGKDVPIVVGDVDKTARELVAATGGKLAAVRTQVIIGEADGLDPGTTVTLTLDISNAVKLAQFNFQRIAGTAEEGANLLRRSAADYSWAVAALSRWGHGQERGA